MLISFHELANFISLVSSGPTTFNSKVSYRKSDLIFWLKKMLFNVGISSIPLEWEVHDNYSSLPPHIFLSSKR